MMRVTIDSMKNVDAIAKERRTIFYEENSKNFYIADACVYNAYSDCM